MNEDVKNEIEIVLDLLRKTLTKNGVSMGLNPEKKQIMFFDTDTYLQSGEFSGFKVKIENLVK